MSENNEVSDLNVEETTTPTVEESPLVCVLTGQVVTESNSVTLTRKVDEGEDVQVTVSSEVISQLATMDNIWPLVERRRALLVSRTQGHNQGVSDALNSLAKFSEQTEDGEAVMGVLTKFVESMNQNSAPAPVSEDKE